MTCILRAVGNNFDVDDFIRQSPLTIRSAWRKGEKRFPNSTTNQTVNESSGVRITASEADFSELAKQIDDVVLFLQKNYDGVKYLASYPGVEGVLLDFGAEIHPPGWASFTFPPELLSLAGSADVSLCLSVYPTEEQEDANPRKGNG